MLSIGAATRRWLVPGGKGSGPAATTSVRASVKAYVFGVRPDQLYFVFVLQTHVLVKDGRISPDSRAAPNLTEGASGLHALSLRAAGA